MRNLPIIADETHLSGEGKARLLKWREACFQVVEKFVEAQPANTWGKLERTMLANAFYGIGALFDLNFAITLPDCLSLADSVMDNHSSVPQA